MKTRHLNRVMAIDNQCYQTPWNKKTWQLALRQTSLHGRIAVDPNKEIVGFIVFDLRKGCLEIIKLGVSPYSRRLGYASILVTSAATIKTNTVSEEELPVTCMVDSEEIASSEFLRSIGFKARRIVRNWDNSGHDAYEFAAKLCHHQ